MRGYAACYIIAVLLALTLPPTAAGDEIEDFAELDLEELLDVNVYAAAKHEQDIMESPSAVSVITREQIENTHCTDVICLLRQLPEVDVLWLRSMFAVVGARALSDSMGDKALVQVDGREINNEVFGMVFWTALPVHLEEIERIEVIRGPGSALYGANAHSLVVSIITRKDTDNIGEVFLGSGEHDRSSLHLRLGRGFGRLRMSVSGGVETGGHFRIRDFREREHGRVRVHLDYETASSSSMLDAGFSLSDGAMYTTLAPAWLNQGLQSHVLLGHQTGAIKAQLALNIINVDASWDIPLYFGEIKLGNAPESMQVFSSGLDGEVQATWSPFENNLWIGGCNYRWITMLSDDIQPGTIHQHRVGIFLHNEQRVLEDLVVTLGVRFDYNSITPFTISPRLAGVWEFADRHFLRLAAGQAFRKPSFFNTSTHIKGFKGEPGFAELEDFFLTNIGNDDLGNESITTLEVGYRGRFLQNRLYAEAVGFYNRYRNTVAMFSNMVTDEFGVPDLASSQFLFANEGREVDSLGGSLAATWQISKALRVHANYTYRYSWYLSDPLDTESGTGAKKGSRVAWEPAHLGNLWFRYLAGSGLRLGASLHGRSSSATTRLEHGGLFDEYIAVENPALLFPSAFASWRVNIGSGWMEMGLRACNFLNVGFRDNMSITRRDGTEVGGELIGRRIFVFLRGEI
jgi:outer membrane receptor for ferrienterochelin and colicin